MLTIHVPPSGCQDDRQCAEHECVFCGLTRTHRDATTHPHECLRHLDDLDIERTGTTYRVPERTAR